MSRVKCLTLLLMSIFSLTGYVAPETEPSPQPNIPRRGEGEEQVPLIMIAILARNAAHTLPNFLGYLESLDYPKHRLAVWIRTDHNEDDTLSMLSEWAGKVQDIYSSVDLEHKEEWLYPSRHPFKKTEERYSHVSQLRQEGLHAAREMKAQYLLLLDTDVFIVNNQTLRILLDQHKPMISPMLEAGQEIAYSNFWCGQDEQGYYKRTPEYLPTVKRERRGCFEVLVLHSLLLIDLQTPESRKLQFWPLLDGFKGPVDDVVHFAYSAKVAGLGMYILNTERFGYIIKKENIYDTLSEAARHFLNFKLENLVNHPPVLYSQYIPRAVPEKDKQGLDEIYMISLERRPERRNRMLACLDELRLNFILFDAVDGK